MASSNFPLMGFPEENNEMIGEIMYQCFFHERDARIAIWRRHAGLAVKASYGVNLYRLHYTDHSPTHAQDRYSINQSPILVEDAFEAQLAINYLIQKHLPTEVTNDVSYAGAERQEAGECNTVPGQEKARGLHTHAAAGETVE